MKSCKKCVAYERRDFIDGLFGYYCNEGDFNLEKWELEEQACKCKCYEEVE